MNLGLKGRRAVVTGASRGIGLAIAQALAAEGARVALVARGRTALARARSTLPGQGHRAIALDLAAARGPAMLMRRLRGFGAPQIVVHGLGGTLGERDPLCGPAAWRRVLRLNLEVAAELNALLAPAMQRERWGRIVHVSSVSGRENVGPVPYCAAKAALDAYTRSLGRVLVPDGVIVTAVAPGAVLAPGNHWDRRRQTDPKAVERYVQEQLPAGRFGAPEEIAAFAAYLCSDRCGQCAGGVFPIDGGLGRAF